MIAGNIPGRTSTMPLAIYSYAASGDWNKAHLMALVLTLLSGFFVLLANHFAGRRG
jgi:molybdate transport system permease protein